MAHLPNSFELAHMLGEAFIELINRNTVVVQQPHPGAWWISYVEPGLYGRVISCYYHPKRRHTATTVGKLGMRRSVANAGHWATSVQTKRWRGNRTYYNTL
jgi:lactococcin 972 family bacteriocin